MYAGGGLAAIVVVRDEYYHTPCMERAGLFSALVSGNGAAHNRASNSTYTCKHA